MDISNGFFRIGNPISCFLNSLFSSKFPNHVVAKSFTVRCYFKRASAVRKEEIKTAFSALWGGALGWRDSLIVCAMLQKFGLFSACVVYKVFNSIIGVTVLGRGCYRLGPRRLWIAWISSNIVAKL